MGWKKILLIIDLFVCVEVLQPSQLNGVMSSMVRIIDLAVTLLLNIFSKFCDTVLFMNLSSQEALTNNFEDTLAPPSASISIAAPSAQSNSHINKKHKFDKTNWTISSNNQAKFKVLKKLHIQLTRTKHHISYLSKCECSKSIPKSLRVNLTPQVPVIYSTLQLKWEKAHWILAALWQKSSLNIGKAADRTYSWK